jgi:hypothetical protein
MKVCCMYVSLLEIESEGDGGSGEGGGVDQNGDGEQHEGRGTEYYNDRGKERTPNSSGHPSDNVGSAMVNSVILEEMKRLALEGEESSLCEEGKGNIPPSKWPKSVPKPPITIKIRNSDKNDSGLFGMYKCTLKLGHVYHIYMCICIYYIHISI